MRYLHGLKPLLTFLILTSLAPASLAAVATIDRLSGNPTIYEIGEAGARTVSLPRQGGQYTLPIEIETGRDDSAIFRLPDSEVAVAPNSVMRIAAPEQTATGLFQRVLQQVGSSLFTVDRQSVEHFQVETPYLVSVVKGTVFNVVVHEEGATVALHEGHLLVTNTEGTRSVNLAAGDVAYSNKRGALEKIDRTGVQTAAVPMLIESEEDDSSGLADRQGNDKPQPTRSIAGESLHEIAVNVPLPATAGEQAADLPGAVADLAVAETLSLAEADLESLGRTLELDDGLTSEIAVTTDIGTDLGDEVGGLADDLVDDVGNVAGDVVGDVM